MGNPIFYLITRIVFAFAASAFVLNPRGAPAARTFAEAASDSAKIISANSPTLYQHHSNSVKVKATAESCYSSNATTIGWQCDDGSGVYETKDEAKGTLTKYLWKNIMPYDVPVARSLGFDPEVMTALTAEEGDGEADDGEEGASDNESSGNESSSGHPSSSIEVARGLKEKKKKSTLVDGLSDGILNQTLHYALLAKQLYPYTDAIPRSIYMEYVVPYAVSNEPRSDHRPLLFHALKDALKEFERQPTNDNKEPIDEPAIQQETATSKEQIKQAVKIINTKLWSILGHDATSPIVFKAGLTPRIYDPLSVIAYGHSSCTGLAILLIGALRAMGIPARMAGTPAWYGKEEEGNHSWVEVFLPNDDGSAKNGGEEGGGGQWIFLEPSPGIAEGDEATANSDDLDRDPCKRWFCGAKRFGNGSNTKVYATRFDKKNAGDTAYPMAWSVGDEGVPGEDRTEYYESACGNCGH